MKAHKFLILAVLPVLVFFFSSAFIQKQDGVVQSSSNVTAFSDSSSLKSHDIHPELFYDESFLNRYKLPFTASFKLTNSVYPNINISRDTFPQNEPSVKISRKNLNIVVAAWRDFRTGVDPAIRRIGYSRSTDGGITWDNSRLLPAHDPMHPRASDPAVCTDTAGNFYISTISLNNSNWDGIPVVYKSTNQGVSFDQSFNIAPHTDTSLFDDKEYITCDLVPGSPYSNNIYVAWAGYDSLTVCRSTNGGMNWSDRIHLSYLRGGTGLVPAVGADGEVYIIWMGGSTSVGSGPGIYFNKSTNGGLNFSFAEIIDTISHISLQRLPSMAVDISNGPRRGFVYAVWSNDVPPNSTDEDIFFKFSSDLGSTWSARKRVNDDPPGNGKWQYWPWISVNELGNIFIIYFDTRNTSSSQIVEAYLAYSTNGGETFVNEVLSTQQFSTNGPNFNVRFGDYIGIDSWGGKTVPVWTDQRAGEYNQEIYTAVIVDSLIGIKPAASSVPDEFKLYQNYPNPFNPSTTIKFEIPKQENVILKVFDILGREVQTMLNEQLKAGTYEVKWDAGSYSSGIYFYKLEVPGFTETRKMIFIK
jgi:hypothetical protein